MEIEEIKEHIYKITFTHEKKVLYAIQDKDNCIVTDHQFTDEELEKSEIKPVVIKDYEGEDGIAGKFTDVKDLAIELLNRNELDFGVVFKSKEAAARFFYHRLDNPTLTAIDNTLFFAYGWYECFTFYGGNRSNCPWGGIEMGSIFDIYPANLFRNARFKATENGIHEAWLDKLFKNGKASAILTKPFDYDSFDLSSYYSNHNVHSLISLRDEVILFLDDVVDYINKIDESVVKSEIKSLYTWQCAWDKGRDSSNLINSFLRDEFVTKLGRNPFGR